MLTWLICGNLYNSFENNHGFMIFTAIILKQTRLNFQNVSYSLGNRPRFCKHDESEEVHVDVNMTHLHKCV